MTLNLGKDELTLMQMLLSKEEGDTRVEIHHCRDHEYKDYLKQRERCVEELLARVREALSEPG